MTSVTGLLPQIYTRLQPLREQRVEPHQEQVIEAEWRPLYDPAPSLYSANSTSAILATGDFQPGSESLNIRYVAAKYQQMAPELPNLRGSRVDTVI